MSLPDFRSVPVRIGLLVLASSMVLCSACSSAADDTENPGKQGNGEFTIGPDYAIDLDLTDKGNPKGQQFEFTMALAQSQIFKGDDKTLEPDKKPVNKERTITVYVPAAYVDGAKAPYLVIHDGPGQLGLVRNALDNLTISKDPLRSLPAFVAIAVQNGGDDSKNSERGLEYDTLSERVDHAFNQRIRAQHLVAYGVAQLVLLSDR